MPQANSTTSWPQADLAEGVGDDLAVLAGDDLGQLTLALVEQFAEPEQYLGALGQRRVTPGRERGGGGVDDGLGVRNDVPRATAISTSWKPARHAAG